MQSVVELTSTSEMGSASAQGDYPGLVWPTHVSLSGLVKRRMTLEYVALRANDGLAIVNGSIFAIGGWFVTRRIALRASMRLALDAPPRVITLGSSGQPLSGLAKRPGR